MSESGCLHSSKFENVKVEKHISSNNILITGEVSVGDTEDHSGPVHPDNGIITQVLTTESAFNIKSDKASTGISGVPLESDISYIEQGTPATIGTLFNNVFSKKSGDLVGDVISYNDRSYYVNWPDGTILKELTIIPNMDIDSIKIATSGATPARFKNELVINLLSSSTLPALPAAVEIDKIVENDDATGVKLVGHFPSPIGGYRAGTFGYGYMIREFPVMSCALDEGGGDEENIRWRKYTPISVIRDIGQPIGCRRTPSGPISQHSTASTTKKLRHGSRIDSTDEGLPKGCITDCLRVDPGSSGMNVNKPEEPGIFSFSTAYRNVGPITFTPAANGSDTIKNTFTNGALNATQPTQTRCTQRGGMFYNSSGRELGLVLTIGHTSNPGQSDENEFTNPTDTNDKGTLQNGGSIFSADNNLRFKAIFTFIPLSSS